MAALMAAVSGEAEVARTSATVGEKVDCVQQFLYWATGSPNTYNSGGPPLWDDCDAQKDDGVQAEPDWDMAAQPAPDYEVDQRVNW